MELKPLNMFKQTYTDLTDLIYKPLFFFPVLLAEVLLYSLSSGTQAEFSKSIGYWLLIF